MRISNALHEAHEWVIGDIARDFKLLDVWELPVEGDLEDFDAFLDGVAAFDPADSGSAVSRALFSLRLRIGEWLGWDDPAKEYPIPGCSETTLSARLPEGLRTSAEGQGFQGAVVQAGFAPLYRTDKEWGAEVSNATVHGVLQLCWVDQGEGRYRGRLAVYVKPRGPLGEAYMMLISPFRHLIVYPALLRQIGRAWDERLRASG